MVALVLRGRLMNGAVVPPLSTYDIIRMAGSGYVVQYCIFDGTEQQHMCCCILSIEESAAEHLSRQALSLACVPPGDPAAFFSSTLTLPTYDRCSCAGTTAKCIIIALKRLKLRLSGSARKSQKRFRDTPMFKFRAVLTHCQPFLSGSVRKRATSSNSNAEKW